MLSPQMGVVNAVESHHELSPHQQSVSHTFITPLPIFGDMVTINRVQKATLNFQKKTEILVRGTYLQAMHENWGKTKSKRTDLDVESSASFSVFLQVHSKLNSLTWHRVTPNGAKYIDNNLVTSGEIHMGDIYHLETSKDHSCIVLHVRRHERGIDSVQEVTYMAGSVAHRDEVLSAIYTLVHVWNSKIVL